ncbi:MAG: OmpA family protein [Candidatus Hydrogenedentes bacterium]|nr:OmpA family protein [Candidatus Hydrogenedentota bacterium]
MRFSTILLASGLLLAAGCRTSNLGVHMIPVTRDYARLEKVTLDSAAESVREAHRRGAASTAPYEYFSALQYLAIARDQSRLGDRQAMWDYAGLAKHMSEAAIRLCPIDSTAPQPPAPPASFEECQEKFQQLKAAYLDLDRDKAVQCSPIIYADFTAMLSRAEHTLNYSAAWPRAQKALELAQADLDAILHQDADNDQIPDLQDADPRLAEDFDNFEDEDGSPDPDNDRDGIPDKIDVSPNEPETVNGYKDHDGAPDQLPALDPVLFARGATDLTGEAKGYLRGVKQLLAEWPRLRLRVSGHGNPAQPESEAMDLSRLRAENVRRWLLDLGVPERQLVVTFYGAAQTPPETARVDLQLE